MFAIVTDTGANLTAEQAEKMGVTVLPMVVDGDGSSGVNPFLCEAELEKLAKKGDVLCICLSDALSGTFRSVQMAAVKVRSENRIRVINSRCASCGEGMLVQLAVRERAKGADFGQVVSLVERSAPKVCHLFLVGDLQNTGRSGRFSEPVSAETVLTLDSKGRIVPCHHSKDRKTALRYIAQMYHRTVLPTAKKVCVAHADNLPDAAYLAGQIGMNTDIAQLNDLFICHTGMHTVSLFYPGTLRTDPVI